MSSNVGLSTPRGSGTSGHIQRNLAFQRPRDNAPYADADRQLKTRQPDEGIMKFNAKRAIEVKVVNLEASLENKGLDPDEIQDRCDELREKLLAELDAGGAQETQREFKKHEVHGMADAKIKESEKLRSALGISKDYQEGDHWRRQEERTRGGPAPADREERTRAPPPAEREERRGERRSRRDEVRDERREYRNRSASPTERDDERREHRDRSASPVEREERREERRPRRYED